jgi:nucleotide-binding universal stress UspA family protein
MSHSVRLERILLVFQPQNPELIDQTFALAKRHGSRVTVIDVVEDADGFHGLLPVASAKELRTVLVDARRADIESALAGAISKPADIDIKIALGLTAVEIIREADRGNHDIVIKSAAGPYGLQGMLFGGTDLKLLRKCPRPVWMVRKGAALLGGRVLAAVNAAGTGGAHDALNRMIVDYAAHIARAAGGRIEILYCWQLPGETLLSSGRTRMAPGEFDTLLQTAERVHRRKLDDFVGRLGAVDVPLSIDMVKGDPGETILSLAKERRSDAVVMGTVGRSGIDGVIIGNTAEKVLSRIECSVLALKPPGFVTPIR